MELLTLAEQGKILESEFSSIILHRCHLKTTYINLKAVNIVYRTIL